ncbi:MAG: tetratricopeptide repeat protein, partial [Myxococcales bacterium]|nr:tetratricopeptide repeat protein [Myxococcales bacterium]
MPSHDVTRKAAAGLSLDVWGDNEADVAALSRELAATGADDKRRAALLNFELGRWALASGDEAGGAQRLLRAYTLRPQFRPTLRLARQIYRERGDFKLTIKLLDAEARATRDPLARAALLRRRARILWMRLAGIDEARKVLEEAHRLDPADLATLKLLEQMYVVDGDSLGRRRAIKRQLETVSDDGLRTALEVDLALLIDSDDPKGALEALQRAEAMGETQAEALSIQLCLEPLYQREGKHRDLSACLVKQAELSDGGSQSTPNAASGAAYRARLYARAARIERDLVGDIDAAARLFLRSLELSPELGAAADAFEMHVAKGRHAEAVRAGETYFELDETPRLRAQIACRVGDMLRRDLNRAGDAIEWYKRCLRWAPSYQPALEGLGKLLDVNTAAGTAPRTARADGEQADAAKEKARAARVDELLRIHRADLASVRDDKTRAHRLYRIAELCERAGREDDATKAHREALAAWPSFRPSTAALERLFARAQRWGDLVDLLQAQLERGDEAERALSLLETMADIYQNQLDDVERAIECYRRMLELSPDQLGALRAMARLCSEAGRWAELTELNGREVMLVNEIQRKVELLERTGEIYEQHLSDNDAAISCYMRALELDPEYLPALRALGRLHREQGRWLDLISMHQAEIAASPDPEQVVSLLYAIAEVYEEHLLDDNKAIETYRAILHRKPGFLPALSALARLLQRRNAWADLCALYESSLDVVSTSTGKAVRLLWIGQLREERLDDRHGALREYQRALRLDPDLAPAQAALASLLERTGDHQQLAELLAEQLERATSPRQGAAIASRLADLLDRQGAPRKAAALYERAQSLEPSVFTLWALAELYERLGLMRELEATLERLVVSIDDPRASAELSLRIGRLREQYNLGDPIEALARARTLPSGSLYAKRTTERFLRQRLAYGDDPLDDSGGAPIVEQLPDLLLARIDSTRDAMELACLWTEVGDLAEQRGDSASAEQAYREALARARGHLPAQWGLERLLEANGRIAELAELVEAQAQGMESTRALADTLVRAAELFEQRLGDAARALPLYERVLKVQPGHDGAYQRMRAILSSGSEWAQLASLIRTQIQTTTEPEVVASMFVELGQLYLDRLGQRAKGMACLRRVLDIDAYNVYSLTVLGDLHYDAGELVRAEELYGRLELVVSDAGELGRVRRRLGELYLALDQPRPALAAFRRAADNAAAQDPWLLRRIAHAAELAREPQSQVAALEKLAECTDDADERVRARKDIARVAEEALLDDQRAVRALQEVLVLDPLDLGAIEHLAGIYGRSANRSAAAQHLSAAIAHHRAELGRRPFDARLYRQLARLFRWQRLYDRLYCACAVLSHLRAIEDVEAQFHRDHGSRCGGAPAGELAPQRYELLLLPVEAQGAVRALLAEVGEAMDKIAGSAPAAYGMSRGARIKGDHPLRREVLALSRVLGLGVDPEVWICTDQPDAVLAEYFSGQALVVGAHVAAQAERGALTQAARFLVGQALFVLAEHAL